MNKRIRLLAILFGVLLGMIAGHFIWGRMQCMETVKQRMRGLS